MVKLYVIGGFLFVNAHAFSEDPSQPHNNSHDKTS